MCRYQCPFTLFIRATAPLIQTTPFFLGSFGFHEAQAALISYCVCACMALRKADEQARTRARARIGGLLDRTTTVASYLTGDFGSSGRPFRLKGVWPR